jgi:hypothetical protein
MTNKKVVGIGKITSILILSLGVIHNIATFTPLIQGGLTLISLADLSAIIYMSLMCGTSLILSGMLLFVMLRKIEQISFLRVPVLIIGIFLALSGILSAFYMPDNPFAWVALFINLSMFAVTLKISL